MKTKYAFKIYEGMMVMNDGNQQSIMGAASIISTANNSMQYQKNPKGNNI